jgi:hypothetical protein
MLHQEGVQSFFMQHRSNFTSGQYFSKFLIPIDALGNNLVQLIGVNVPLRKTCLKLRFKRLIIKFRACDFIKAIIFDYRTVFSGPLSSFKVVLLEIKFFHKGF